MPNPPQQNQFLIFRIPLDGRVETGILRFGPASFRGAFRDRHGRWMRDAMDAGGAKDEGADSRTAKSCGPDASTLASSFAEATPRGDGDNKARSPGRARYKPLKPLRGECRAISGVTVVTTLVCLFYFACEAAGAAGVRHSLRPLISGVKVSCTIRAQSAPREGGSAFWIFRHCQRQNAKRLRKGAKATKQSMLPCCAMDCFASARNDGLASWAV